MVVFLLVMVNVWYIGVLVLWLKFIDGLSGSVIMVKWLKFINVWNVIWFCWWIGIVIFGVWMLNVMVILFNVLVVDFFVFLSLIIVLFIWSVKFVWINFFELKKLCSWLMVCLLKIMYIGESLIFMLVLRLCLSG